MKITLKNFIKIKNKKILPYSTIKILHEAKSKENVTKKEFAFAASAQSATESDRIVNKKSIDKEYRENEMKIQMLSNNLYEQIFKDSTSQCKNPELIAK